eukprot:49734-Eustigmatos_ZCMA.PRE.1
MSKYDVNGLREFIYAQLPVGQATHVIEDYLARIERGDFDDQPKLTSSAPVPEVKSGRPDLHEWRGVDIAQGPDVAGWDATGGDGH